MASSADAATQRLRVHSKGRMLVQANGDPFFWMGDTNWRLYKLTQSEVVQYLNDRRARQFNVIQGPVLLSSGTSEQFTTPTGEANTDPGNPNESFFQHIDYIVNAANQRNLHIALVAVWGDDWQLFGSVDAAHEYGVFLGNRYRNFPNVVWIVAGEYSINGFDSAIMDRWDALGRGLKQGSNNSQLVTIHGSHQLNGQSSSIAFHDADWLDFNMVQSSQSGTSGAGADNWNLIKADMQKRPKKPVIDAEANYEKFGDWDAFGVRRRAYWSVFAGAFGHTYGANGVWSSYAGEIGAEGNPPDVWQDALKYTGGNDMRHLRRLMQSRPMLNRSPADKALQSDAGSGADHISVTRDKSGRYMMVYVPGRDRSFTINMNKVDGPSVRAWWFDPSKGTATLAGTFAASGSQTFQTPSTAKDWVLVLDQASRNYPKPGTGGPLK